MQAYNCRSRNCNQANYCHKAFRQIFHSGAEIYSALGRLELHKTLSY